MTLLILGSSLRHSLTKKLESLLGIAFKKSDVGRTYLPVYSGRPTGLNRTLAGRGWDGGWNGLAGL